MLHCGGHALHTLFKRFHKNWELNASLIEAFSSIFFLSYAKINFIIFQSLLCTTLRNEEGKLINGLAYIDPTVPYASKKHVYIIIFSAFVAIFLYFPPILLLIIYPTSLCIKISDRIRPRWRIGIKIYVETYQGCYKDSTNGTRDYRAMSGYSLIVPVISVVMLQIITIEDSFTVDNNLLQYGLFMIVVVFIILCSLLQPCIQTEDC